MSDSPSEAAQKWAELLRTDVKKFNRVKADALFRAGRQVGAGRHRVYIDLMNVDLQGLDLKGADLSLVKLHDANLNGSNLEDVNFAGSILIRIKFRDASLRRVYFVKAEARRASFEGARLEQCYFLDSVLIKTSWQGATFDRCLMQAVKLWESDFSRADLQGSAFLFHPVEGVPKSFSGAKLIGSGLRILGTPDCRFLVTTTQVLVKTGTHASLTYSHEDMRAIWDEVSERDWQHGGLLHPWKAQLDIFMKECERESHSHPDLLKQLAANIDVTVGEIWPATLDKIIVNVTV